MMAALNLDNFNSSEESQPPCTKGAFDMAKRQRFHIDLPEGDLWLTGNTVSEAFLNGFERYQKITQMPAEPSIPPSPPFREVFEQYQRKPLSASLSSRLPSCQIDILIDISGAEA